MTAPTTPTIAMMRQLRHRIGVHQAITAVIDIAARPDQEPELLDAFDQMHANAVDQDQHAAAGMRAALIHVTYAATHALRVAGSGGVVSGSVSASEFQKRIAAITSPLPDTTAEAINLAATLTDVNAYQAVVDASTDTAIQPIPVPVLGRAAVTATRAMITELGEKADTPWWISGQLFGSLCMALNDALQDAPNR